MNELSFITALDGFELGATLFQPTHGPRGTVIVNGATGVPASYYAAFAEHLAASGLRVVTYDYRGVGASRPDSLRGFSATMSDWAVRDARSVLEHVRARFGEAPLFWVGHSFGGQALGLIDDARQVTGAVLVGSQLGDVDDFPLPDRLKLRVLFGGVLPAVTRSFGYLPGAMGVGEDLPRGVAEEWARWCLTRGYFLQAHPVARRRFARFDKPTLLFSMSDDDYAPEPAVAQLVGLLSNAPLEHRRVVPSELGVGAIGHFGFFRPRFTDTLWREVRWFIDDLVDGKKGFRPRRARAPWNLEDEDVALDLAYGRA